MPQTAGSAGADIAAAEGAVLQPMERRLFATGFAVAIKSGVTLPNTPATIDSDYRGELKVGLVNLGSEPVEIVRGMRIAQLVLARVEAVQFEAVESLPPTTRGPGGFGSTGR
jgi:dUTP pyrophosphatase